MTNDITAREYHGGIVAIDSGMLRREMAACYLLETPDQVALIEVGSNASTQRILSVLQRRGWRPEQVSHVIATHVHLDHAGGAGNLMQAVPNATLVVHPFGARHLVDPARLEAGARAVYGDAEFDKTYGKLVPVPQQRVRTMADGETLAVGQRELLFMDSPGHARHHFCIWDQQTRGWFTGDTFGISYREFDTANGAFIFPATTPVQFDPDALVSSIERLMARSPEFMYLTHFGRVGDTRRLAEKMITGVRKLVEFGEKHAASPSRRQDIERDMLEWMVTEVRAHGVTMTETRLLDILRPDVTLNTQGIEHWLNHRD
jgi:glyoxylase-like metal-dependent hydrolase (beta-lactamase superfamily II)